MKSNFPLAFRSFISFKVILIVLLFLTTSVFAQGQLVRIDIQPNDFGIYPGATITFTATGYDADSTVVPLVDPTWTGTGGPLTPNGNRCDLIVTDIGSHFITCSKDSVTGTAIFNIMGPLHRITIKPDTAYLAIGDSVELIANGYDEFDNQVPLQELSWSATGGIITTNPGSSNILYSATGDGSSKPAGYNATFIAADSGNHTVTATDQGIDGTATMIVGGGPGPLDHIVLIPPSATVQTGQSLQFTPEGFESQGNSVPIIPTWTTTGGTITQTGFYTATKSGDFTITASDQGINGTAKVHVTQSGGQIVKIKVDPRRVILTTGGKQKFKATGYDRYGRPVPFNPIWNAARGTITQEGLYTTSSKPGVDLVTAQAPGIHVRGYAWVIIRPKLIKKIEVTPDKVKLAPGQIQQFTARAYDISGQPVDVPFTWSATGGKITQQGIYTAGSSMGSFSVRARTQNSLVMGMAHVQIASNLHNIVLKPASATLQPGGKQQFTATGYDVNGRVVPFTAIWSTTGGKITQSGLYSAGSRNGTFMIMVRAKGTWKWAKANVSIYQRLTRIVMKPTFSILKRKENRQFSATGYDLNGRVVPFSAVWSTNGGSVTQQGRYTAPSKRKIYTITVKDRESAVSGRAVVWVR